MKHILSKNNRALLAELVRTDFKLRYQGSVLGYTWSLLKPLLMFGILYMVFVKFLRLGGSIEHYPIYLLFGIVLWNFFSEMTSQSLSAVVGRGDLIRKIKIPRWIIVISSSLSALINLALNLLVVGVFMVFNQVDVRTVAVFLPLLFIQVYIFALGISFFLSAAYVKYRDVSYIWDVCLQAGFYLTPILYPLQTITNPLFQKILLMNPLAQALQDARFVLVTPSTLTIHNVFSSPWPYLVTLPVTLGVLLLGGLYFKRESRYFAENL